MKPNLKTHLAISIIRPAIASVIFLLLLLPAQSAFAGSIVGWGYNWAGQATPPSGNNYIAIAAGGYHSLALRSDGTIVAWGRNDDGEANPPAGNRYIDFSARWLFSLALRSDGSIVGFGSNRDQRGQWSGQAIPPAGNNFVAVAGGGYHSLALRSDGSIVGWGYNYNEGGAWAGQASPPTGNNFIAIVAGGYHSLALKSDGSIVGWGDNPYGQATPPTGNNYIAISAGLWHSLALRSDGTIVGWGRNEYGQATPPTGNNYIAISAGWHHSLALRSDGSIAAWGDDRNGAATPPGGNDYIAIAAGAGHSLALKGEGAGTGMLYGIVRDQQTGASIAGAEVFIAGMPHLTANSDATGHYEIVGVPYNTLFTLVASASGYETSYTDSVQVTEANPFETVDIDLTPSASQSLRLTELDPNPNADSMVIMNGGTGHWYYQIVDEEGDAGEGNVTTSLGTTFYSSSIIRPGVVRIDVNSLDVTDGQTITITHLNGTALEPAEQKSFMVSISPLEQEKTWEIRAAGDLGVSNLIGEAEGSMEISLSDEQGSDSNPEIIYVSRKALLGGGVSVSAKIGAGGQVGGFGANAGAGIEGSVTAGGIVRDMFGYAYNTDDLSENAAKLDLLLYPTTLLSPQLVLIQSALDATLQSSYREEFEAGVYIKGSGSAWGNLLLGSPKAGVGIGPHGYAGASVLSTASFLWRKADEYAIAVEVGGDWKVQGGVLVGGIQLTKNISIGIPLLASAGGLSSVRFELCFDSNLVLKKIKVALSVGQESGIIGYDVSVDQIEWTITGPPQSLVAMVSPGGILDVLLKSLQATSPHIVEFDPHAIVNELDQVFASIQRQRDLSVTYEIKQSTGVTVNVGGFDFEIGAGAGIEADVGAGLEGGISETRDLVVQRGKVVGIQMYPTESYSKEIYGPINITLADVYAKALLDVGQQVIQAILDYGEQIVHAGQEVILNAGNSILQIGADVLEAGQRIFTVFEAQFGQKMMALAVDSNMPLENKYFGIGGTYRLEPADLNLPAPATFSISYSDSDGGSKDESAFRMYRWNDSTGKWEFIGGTIDITNNTVTASIVRFGTYAIGARVEYGHFTFDAEPNAAPSDGNSIITFASEIVRNNDGTQVADSTLFTLGVSGGTITTVDANTSLEGVQIVTNSGILEFTLKAPQVGMKVEAEAVSLSRLAVVTGDVNFVDFNAPQPPTGLQAQIVDGKVLLSWNANSEIDLAGYKIYFDDDQSGAPYEGAAYYSGHNSPVDVADANSHILRGLQSGHTYYVTLTAYDVPGNESLFGSEVVFVNTLPPDSDSDGMPDSWEVKYANAANGLLPTGDDSMLDNDGDGLPNSEEYMTDNDPLNPDSDEDGVEDSVDMCQTNRRPGLSVDANGCAVGDFDSDGRIGLPDLSRVIAHWLDADCNEPDWCEGTDFDLSTNVNFTDFSDFARAWSLELLEPVMGDFNWNRIVDIEDVAIFAGQWLQICTGPSWCDRCDTDKSSFVDFADFTQSAEHWLEGVLP